MASDVRWIRRPWIPAMLVLVGCAIIVASRSFLIAESSEQLAIVLEHGVGYRIDQALIGTRPLRFLPKLPVVALSTVTSDLSTLVFTNGAGFALVPIVCAACVWRLLGRTAPLAAALAVSSVLMVGLPGQIYLISGQLMAGQVVWVLLACIVCGQTSRSCRWVGALCALVLFFLHAVSSVMFAAIGGYLLARSFVKRDGNRFLVRTGVLLSAAAVARLALLRLSWDWLRVTDSTHPSQMKLRASLEPPDVWFMGAYFVLLIGAALLILIPRGRVDWRSATLLAVATLCLLSFFAVNETAIVDGTNYLAWWIPFVSIPIHGAFLFLVLDGKGHGLASGAGLPMVSVAALAFLAVSAFASYRFSDQLEEARTLVEGRGDVCVAREDLFLDLDSPFADEFGYFEYIYAMTSATRFQPVAVLDRERCSRLCRPSYTSPVEAGTFFQVERSSERGVEFCPLGNLFR